MSRGEILQAQARLGHRDAATTLREYAYALPLSDGHVADLIDDHLDLSDDVRACAVALRSGSSSYARFAGRLPAASSLRSPDRRRPA